MLLGCGMGFIHAFSILSRSIKHVIVGFFLVLLRIIKLIGAE